MMNVNTYTYTYIHMYTHIHICTYIHTYTHGAATGGICNLDAHQLLFSQVILIIMLLYLIIMTIMFCLFQYSKGSWPLPAFAVLVMEPLAWLGHAGQAFYPPSHILSPKERALCSYHKPKMCGFTERAWLPGVLGVSSGVAMVSRVPWFLCLLPVCQPSPVLGHSYPAIIHLFSIKSLDTGLE